MKKESNYEKKKHQISTRTNAITAFIALLIVVVIVISKIDNSVPGSVFYSSDLALENIHSKFLSNDISRLHFQYKIAGERMDESRDITGKSKLMPISVDAYSKSIEEINRLFESIIKDPNVLSTTKFVEFKKLKLETENLDRILEARLENISDDEVAKQTRTAKKATNATYDKAFELMIENVKDSSEFESYAKKEIMSMARTLQQQNDYDFEDVAQILTSNVGITEEQHSELEGFVNEERKKTKNIIESISSKSAYDLYHAVKEVQDIQLKITQKLNEYSTVN